MVYHLHPDTLNYVLSRLGYSNLAAFERLSNFNFTVKINNQNSNYKFCTGFFPISKFYIFKYKNCLLVKHPQNLKIWGIPKEFKDDSFSRPIYWNDTLKGWIASKKDLENLKKLGATPN